MPRPMRYFNGRTPFQRMHGYIAARSKAEAVRLGKRAFSEWQFSTNELNNYWSECWGTAADQQLGEQTEPGVWLRVEPEGAFFKLQE